MASKIRDNTTDVGNVDFDIDYASGDGHGQKIRPAGNHRILVDEKA